MFNFKRFLCESKSEKSVGIAGRLYIEFFGVQRLQGKIVNKFIIVCRLFLQNLRYCFTLHDSNICQCVSENIIDCFRFLTLIENTIQQISFTEFLGCTLDICLVGYYVIMV